MGKAAQALTAVCGVLVIVAFVLFAVLFEQSVNQELEDMAYVCDKGSDFYPSWKDSDEAGAHLLRSFYFYNIVNPTEALNGGSFKLVEVGPFAFEFTGQKFDIEFKSGGTVHYREFQRLTFSKKHSCDECTETFPITTVNIAWQTILVEAQSEGMLALASTCSQAQLANMRLNPSYAACTPSEIQNKTTTCKCCDPATFGCATLASPANNVVIAMISYMSKFDSSAVVSEGAPNAKFPMLDAVYSPSIVTTSPRGIIGGRPSALLGFMQARAALNSSDPGEDTLMTLDQFTRAYYDACKGYCPNPVEYATNFQTLGPAAQLQQLRTTVCDGIIKEQDTDKNYLVGMSCKAATPTFFALAFATDYTCADGGTKPCCMISATMAPFGGQDIPGWGCVRELPGYLLTRKTDSRDEYAETNTWEFEQKTGCKGSSKSDAQDMVEFKSQREFSVWYTPDDFVFPNMPYADTVPVKNVADGVVTGGELTSFTVTGKDVGVKKPKGFTTGFFEFQGSDGKMSGEKVSIFSRTLQQPIEFSFDRKSTVKGINVAKFTMDFVKLTEQTEENQRKGFGVPYAGVYAGLQYAMGVPAFVSFPHFYLGDPSALTQNDNNLAVLGTPSTSGIELSSLVRSYSEPSSLLDEADAIAIDAAYVEANKPLYDVSVSIDPWSGKTLASTVVLMISTTMWRCHPQLNQQGCAPFRMNTTDLCFASAGASFPCSASNMFSPKMLGAKIIPNFFVTEKSEVDDDTVKTFKVAFATRQASHIMLVVGVVIGAALLVGAYWVGRNPTKKTVERVGSRTENVLPGDGTSGKGAAIEMEGKDTW